MSNIVKLIDGAKVLFIGFTKMKPVLYLHRVRHDKLFDYDNWINVKIELLERVEGALYEIRQRQLSYEKNLKPMFINKSKSGLKDKIKGGGRGRPRKGDLPHWKRAEHQEYIECPCFARVKKYQFYIHKKTKKHQRYEESLTAKAK